MIVSQVGSRTCELWALSVHPVTVGRPYVERARAGGFTDRYGSKWSPTCDLRRRLLPWSTTGQHPMYVPRGQIGRVFACPCFRPRSGADVARSTLPREC